MSHFFCWWTPSWDHITFPYLSVHISLGQRWAVCICLRLYSERCVCVSLCLCGGGRIFWTSTPGYSCLWLISNSPPRLHAAHFTSNTHHWASVSCFHSLSYLIFLISPSPVQVHVPSIMQHAPVVQEHESVRRQALMSKQTLRLIIIIMTYQKYLISKKSTSKIENLFFFQRTLHRIVHFQSLI